MGPDKDEAPHAYYGEPTGVGADECDRLFLALSHIGKFANLLEPLPLRVVVPGTDLVGQGRAQCGREPIGSIAVVADEQLQPHRVAKWNEAVEDLIIANEPRTHANDDGERGDCKGHEPAF